MISTDVLVIGSGAAGLIYAIKLAAQMPEKEIIILAKSEPEESNTKYAQGGVAVVLNKVNDNFEKHIDDTLVAGAGICTRDIVEMVIKDAPNRVLELADWGVFFDQDTSGNYDMGREGGHSQNRVIHHKDNTGEAIGAVLLKKIVTYNNIKLLDHHLAIDLLLTDNKDICLGAEVWDVKSNRKIRFAAAVTVLATGGCGHIYENTTNPSTCTGDGIALAQRADAQISNMHYIQFHPTAIYENHKGKLSLVSEALRGAGAKLLDINGNPFMLKYDAREELASRDIVSQAIYSEMKLHASRYVYLDCRGVGKEIIDKHFPNIYKDCIHKGFDLHTDLLPVIPASHYLCGGIDVDKDGNTSIANLYAIGECSNTGLHGGNRLASNSLLEALVFGHRAALSTVSRFVKSQEKRETVGSVANVDKPLRLANNNDIEKIRTALNTLMSNDVGIVRTHTGLRRALKMCDELDRQFAQIYDASNLSQPQEELRNLLCVAHLIIEHSMAQTANIGTFYNKDLDEDK